MNEGDLIFMDGQVVARAKRSVAVEPGQTFSFTIPGQLLKHDDAPRPAEREAPYGVVSCIFREGGVQHWQIRIHGGETEPGAWLRSGWFRAYDGKPASSPQGMVTALDLVIAQVDDSEFRMLDHLTAMRSYFAHRARFEE